jgi:hypothetical protein
MQTILENNHKKAYITHDTNNILLTCIVLPKYLSVQIIFGAK